MDFAPNFEMDPAPGGQQEPPSPPGNGTALGLISDTGGLNSPKEPLRACVKADGAGKKNIIPSEEQRSEHKSSSNHLLLVIQLGLFFSSHPCKLWGREEMGLGTSSLKTGSIYGYLK